MYKVKCEICSNYFKGLAGHLKVKHNISTEEYKIKYPNALTLSKEFYEDLENRKLSNIKKCENCENNFNFSDNKKKRFCSPKCKYEYISGKRKGLKISNNYILRKCQNCGCSTPYFLIHVSLLFFSLDNIKSSEILDQ